MWGTTYAVSTELLPAGRPLLAATARALLAGLALLAVIHRLPSGQWWARSLILGGLNIGGFFACLFIAADRLPGGLAAVLASCQPLLVLGLTPLVLGRSVTPRQIGYATVGVAGIALLVLRAVGEPDALGVSAALGAAASSALGLTLTRRWRPPVGVWTLTAWQLTAGGLLLLPLLVAVEGLPAGLDAQAVVGFAWLIGPSTIVGYYLWFDGIGRLEPVALAALGMLSPLTAATLGWLWLHETMTLAQIGGAAVTLLAVLLLQRPAGPPPVDNVESTTSDRSAPLTPRVKNLSSVVVAPRFKPTGKGDERHRCRANGD
jgi:probable blue pigment (indigoidine) exporter